MAKKVKVKTKAVCPECGAEKRPNTLFCYSCGARLAEGPLTIGALPEPEEAQPGTETQAALDELAEKLKIETPDDDKLAAAAAERKRARAASRQPKQIRWEPSEDGGDQLVLLLAILISVIAGAVVLVTVIWK